MGITPKNLVMSLIALCALFALYLLSASSEDSAPKRGFEFIAIGDAPYFIPADYEGFGRLTHLINAENPAFTVHIGDIKDGEGACSDRNYQEVFKLFQQFEEPLIYTPGDNDWTDCHREEAGAYDPLERLKKVRELFFLSNPDFEKALTLTRQSEDPRFAEYVENARWQLKDVLFVTLHTVGNNNNLPDPSAKKNKKNEGYGNPAEYAARNQANLAWLKEAYRLAQSPSVKGLVILTHADPFFEKKAKKRTGLNDFTETLSTETIALKKPVLLVHGSTHVFRMDKPLVFESDHQVISNFTRVLVFGEQDIHGVKVTVDPQDDGLFTIKPLLVPGNLHTEKP